MAGDGWALYNDWVAYQAAQHEADTAYERAVEANGGQAPYADTPEAEAAQEAGRAAGAAYDKYAATWEAYRYRPEPEPEAGPEADDLGLTPDDWDALVFAYNYGTLDPAEGSVEERAFERLAARTRAEKERSLEQDEADRQYAAWAEAHPEEHQQQVAEHEARMAEAEPF